MQQLRDGPYFIFLRGPSPLDLSLQLSYDGLQLFVERPLVAEFPAEGLQLCLVNLLLAEHLLALLDEAVHLLAALHVYIMDWT